MSSNQKSMYMATPVVVAPVGATLSVFVSQPDSGVRTTLNVVAGATAQVIGCTLGVTLTAAQLANFGFGGASQAAWVQSAAMIPLTLNGPCAFYIGALGATATVCVVQEKAGMP